MAPIHANAAGVRVLVGVVYPYPAQSGWLSPAAFAPTRFAPGLFPPVVFVSARPAMSRQTGTRLANARLAGLHGAVRADVSAELSGEKQDLIRTISGPAGRVGRS